jgi:hypothetical protein
MTKLERITVVVYETSEVAIDTLVTDGWQIEEINLRIEKLAGEKPSIVEKRVARMSAMITMINEGKL